MNYGFGSAVMPTMTKKRKEGIPRTIEPRTKDVSYFQTGCDLDGSDLVLVEEFSALPFTDASLMTHLSQPLNAANYPFQPATLAPLFLWSLYLEHTRCLQVPSMRSCVA